MFISAFLKVFVLLLFVRFTAGTLRASQLQSLNLVQRDCTPVKWIVVNSRENQIYNTTIHTDLPLRLFDKFPSGCTTKDLALRDSSPRTDIQLRDTRTELSTFVYKRGFLSWAASIFKWVNVAVGIFSAIDCFVEWTSQSVAGKLACVLGGICTVIGAGQLAMEVYAALLPTPQTAAQQYLTYVNSQWSTNAEDYQMNPLKGRSLNNTMLDHFNSFSFPGMKHMHDLSNVTLLHLLQANESTPLQVWHHNTYLPLKSWTSVNNATGSPRFNHMTPLNWFAANSTSTASKSKRQSCPGSAVNLIDGELQNCEYPTDSPPPDGGPTDLYYGYDLYGTKAEIEEFEDDIGVTYAASNGQMDAILDMANDMSNDNAWDTCLCYQTQGTWIATGSVQMSWDQTYNGYSECWNPNCYNAASTAK